VAPFRDALSEAGLDSRSLGGVTVCAIGPGTARALAALGVRPDIVPADHRAEGILEVLDSEQVAGRRILLPRASAARAVLPQTLQERGARVDVVPVYETVLPDAEEVRPGLARIEAREVDVLTFTSASTARNFAALAGERLVELAGSAVVAAIGPITRDACEEAGLRVDVMPESFTLPALVEALVQHYRQTTA
jgi:uroporphyrinogen III methyltransferase/synthase